MSYNQRDKMNIVSQLKQRFSRIICIIRLKAFSMGCPMAKAGQHKGKQKKNTLILEAICDPDTYIWYYFFGEPGTK